MVGIDISFANIEAETALLGCIISDNSCMVKCMDSGIVPDDFVEQGFGFVYYCMSELFKSNKPIEAVSLISYVRSAGGSIEASDVTAMALAGIVTSLDYYISEIKTMSFKRRIVAEINDIVGEMKNNSMSQIKSSIADLLNSASTDGEVQDLYCDISEIKRVEMNSGLQLGFSELDYLTNGLVFGSLTVLTGEPSSGKSTLLNQIIAHNIASGYKALIYSGELTAFNTLQWFMRTVANVEDLKEYRGANGTYYDVNSRGENAIRNWIKNRLFLFNEESVANIENITVTIDYLAREKGLKLVVIDNMMTVENSGDEELEKQKNLSKSLKSLARKHGLCVILVAHPKKKDRRDKYHMHDVSGASEVVNLADYEFLLTRTIDDKDDITRIVILKNRVTGKQGIKRVLHFDEIRKRFYINSDERNRDYKYIQLDQICFTESDAYDAPF